MIESTTTVSSNVVGGIQSSISPGIQSSISPMVVSNSNTSVKVAVRIRPLSLEEKADDSTLCINIVDGEPQVIAGSSNLFTYDHVFGINTTQNTIYNECVVDLINSAFEGFNATILAYGQTGSGKTYTMGSASDMRMTADSAGIIPRVIHDIFQIVTQREEENPNTTYKIQVQFLELYGEDIKDLLDHTKTSKVAIRETAAGEVFVSGAREEVVSSAAQMMKALEDGTKHRTTAATRMNQSSSRSHAIFTVIIQQTVHIGGIIDIKSDANVDSNYEIIESSDNPDCNYEIIESGDRKEYIKIDPNISHDLNVTQTNAEVRTCKFHFVDLAGSERAKRTGAQGLQLKEGIDINKGLLALGNVISALGDETKRGKVHVPYRDSKLTRILQDSLGGNSKTLMICCVSPAGTNYHESLNALRYANRARNIQNKPVVNRDPTLIVIDELKNLLKVVSLELMSRRKNNIDIETAYISDEQLQNLINFNGNGAIKTLQTEKNNNYNSPKRNSFSKQTISHSNSQTNVNLNNELSIYKSRLTESEFEIQRLSDQLKLLRQQISDTSESSIVLQSERDFYKLKWESTFPILESKEDQEKFNDNIEDEKSNVMKACKEYIEEISILKSQIADMNYNSTMSSTVLELFDGEETAIETQLTESIARVIAQTEIQLRQETKKLMVLEEETSEIIEISDDDSAEEQRIEQETKAFQRRQKLITSEVEELGQSIKIKEQLMLQLQRSQYQYEVMKNFYENKLQLLSQEVQQKQSERDRLELDLQEIIQSKLESTTVTREHEKVLRDKLLKKDEELAALKRRQNELNNLSQVQIRSLKHLSKLEEEICSMKKQRVDLTKSLQIEKKKHFTVLSEKIKEIDRLKVTLHRTTKELKKVGKDRDKAVNKVKEILKEGAVMRKKSNFLLKFSSEASIKSARKVMSYATKSSGSYCLNENDLKIHKWLDKCITSIVEKEQIAVSLKKHCEQQLSLLHKKSLLENKRVDDDVNEELEDELDSLESQLKLRNDQIYEIRHQLSRSEKILPETTIELLKRNFAATLPSSHDVIKVLINMIIRTRNVCETQKQSLRVSEERSEVLKNELDDTVLKLQSLTRTRTMDLDRAANEHEEKLQGLFTHSSIGQLILSESKNKDSENITNEHKRLVSFSQEQINILKNQLNKEQHKNSLLLSTIDELELNESNYKGMIEDKDIQIKFLEDERRLFQDMADEMRVFIKSQFGNEKIVGLNFISDDSDNEEDDDYNSETILEEFEVLSAEIFQKNNGGVFDDRSGRGIVYDRLTNPSNFTGSMKNVFEQDLAKKREKIQNIKQQATKPSEKNGKTARRKSKDESKYNQIVDYLLDENSAPQSEDIDSDTLQTGQSDDLDTIQTIKSIELDMDDNNRDSQGVFDRLYSKQKLQSMESKSNNDQQLTNKEQPHCDLSVTDRLYAMKTTSLLRRQLEDSKLAKTYPPNKPVKK